MHLAFGRRAMLADDMGLGKTVQAIAAAALLKEMRDIQTALIICPASLKHQWAREIRRFTSLSVTIVEGNLKARRDLYRDSSFFKIINYELVRHDMDELLKLRQQSLHYPIEFFVNVGYDELVSWYQKNREWAKNIST